MALKSSRASIHQVQTPGDIENLLKDQCTKFHLQGMEEGGQSGLEMHEESLGLVALGRELKEKTPGSLC